jgi:hypothetical protein
LRNGDANQQSRGQQGLPSAQESPRHPATIPKRWRRIKQRPRPADPSPVAMTSLSPTAPIARAAAVAARTPWNHFRRRWTEWMIGRPEDQLIAGLWTVTESRAAFYLGLMLLLLLPAAIGLGLGPADSAGRFVLVATALAAVFAASEVEVQRRTRGVALLPLIAGLASGLAVSAIYATVLWSDLPGVWSRHTSIFLVFPLLVLATGLRGDPRLSAATGFFCSLGFVAVAAAAPSFTGENADKAAELARHLDTTSVGIQLAILACSTVFGTAMASHERTLRRTAHCDPLTGLIRAETFERCLEREVKRSVRSELPLTLALIDLDRFRQLNDAHGHTFGDAILSG